jgi:hypothetical protein
MQFTVVPINEPRPLCCGDRWECWAYAGSRRVAVGYGATRVEALYHAARQAGVAGAETRFADVFREAASRDSAPQETLTLEGVSREGLVDVYTHKAIRVPSGARASGDCSAPGPT